MSASLIQVIGELTIAASVAIVIVAAVRKPLRRIGGARIAYLCWLLVPTSQLVVLLPAPSQPLQMTVDAIPQALLRALPTAVSSSLGAAGADYASIGLVGWASGSLLLLFYVVRRQRAFIRSLGPTTAMPDGTHRSSSVRTPLLVGAWRPRIVLPVDFESLYDHDDRALVLAHERAHRDRGDQLVNVVATLWLCLSWFNPLMYWALGRLRFDQEISCDAMVLAARPTLRRRYANALLRAQIATESGWRAPVACSWQSSHPLTERITMLKHPLPTPTRRRSALVLTCALIAAANYGVWTTLPRSANAQAQVNSTVGQTLNEAITLLNAGQSTEAKLKIGTLDLGTLTPYERSHAELVLYNLAFQEGRLDDARGHLQKALDAGGLTPEQATRVRDQATQQLAEAAGR
jgi:beta-lactamase regulating signal transducer with metallopeptidase domain